MRVRNGSRSVTDSFLPSNFRFEKTKFNNCCFSFKFELIKISLAFFAKSSFLNFKWRHQKAGGGQSVFWYEQWLETGDKKVLGDIINYNEDDVRATECLYLWYQNNINLNKSLACLIKTKELIFYSIQLTDAVQREIIRPEYLGKCFTVPEPHSNNQFSFELDWTQHPEIFKQTADDAQVSIASHAIIVCKESYHSALRVKKEENSDLYGAQMILKFVRDAMGHMKAESNNHAIPYWRIDKEKKRTIYEVKKIGMIFNAEILHEKPFKFSHIGGLANFVKLLDFLIQDLKEKLKTNNL